MDRRKIEQMTRALRVYDETIATWEALRDGLLHQGQAAIQPHSTAALIRQLAEERLLERAFLALSDAAILTIEWLIHRDVGSYEEMVDILELEAAIHTEEGRAMRLLVQHYRALTRDYLQTYASDPPVHNTFENLSLPSLARLSALLRTFWLKEGVPLDG